MKRPNASMTLLFSTGLFAVASATQPPDVVQTDTRGNTAMGTSVLQSLISGETNTGAGELALNSTVDGSFNTAIGTSSMRFNTSGNYNTAIGSGSLSYNTDSWGNTAVGYAALYSSTGSHNTATGFTSMEFNGTGYYNSAYGEETLLMNNSGNYNTAVGSAALKSNVSGSGNTAVGGSALQANTGAENTGCGASSLFSNTSGDSNSAFGRRALYHNTTGSNNIGLGAFAGSNVTTGSNNIEIGSAGGAGDQNTIRLGTQGSHTAAYVAGVFGTPVTGSPVYITSTGQLGVLASSERYKIRIAPMGNSTDRLQQLKPVTFQLKQDPGGAVQYGLIAEEVARVYPELVIRDAAGRIEGVRYDELAPMLLNDLQQQRKQVAEMRAAMADLKQQYAAMQAALRKLGTGDERLATR